MIESPSALITRPRLILAGSILLAIGVPALLLMPRGAAVEDQQSEIIPLPLKIATMEAASEAVSAPLFNAERRAPLLAPDGSPSGETGSAPAEAGPPAIVGLITGGRSPALALVRSSDGQTAVVRTGEVVDGWKVAAITAGGVTFAKGSDERQVSLDYGNRNAGDGRAGSASTPPSPPTQTGQ